MKVTPLDLRKQRFRTAMRGFERTEVTAFLTELADEYEQALRETDHLRDELARVEALLNEYREHERNLRATLMSAQRFADDTRTTAEEESKRVLRDAEEESKRVLRDAEEERKRALRDAEEERKRITRDAESRAELLVQKTQIRLEDSQREIESLKLKRHDAESSLEAVIATLHNALDHVREQDQRERDDKILLHRPKQAASTEPADEGENRKTSAEG
jgi:cell division initiation protein